MVRFIGILTILQHGLVEAQIGNQLLQPEVFFLKLAHVLQLRGRNTTVFLAPRNGMDYLLPLRLTVRNVLTRRITMNIVFLGIDLAKNVFQLCGLNQAGKPVYTK